MPSPDLASRETFTWFYQEKLRFSDTDMIGHVNNVSFAALMESGRTNYTRSGVIAKLPRDILVVMRRLDLEYRAELHWPAELDIGVTLLSIGRTSFALGSAIFHGPLCASTAVTTLVVIGRQTRRPAPIPDDIRAGMEQHLAAARPPA